MFAAGAIPCAASTSRVSSPYQPCGSCFIPAPDGGRYQGPAPSLGNCTAPCQYQQPSGSAVSSSADWGHRGSGGRVGRMPGHGELVAPAEPGQVRADQVLGALQVLLGVGVGAQ